MTDRPNDMELRALYQRLVEARSDSERRSCPTPEQIVALADRTLPESDRLTHLGHVSACSHCQRDLSIARAVAEPQASRSARSIGRGTGGLAAAAIIVFAVVMATRDRDREPEVLRSTDTAVEVVRPSGVGAATDTLFVWRTVDRARTYRVEVMTAGGNLVQSGETADTAWALPRRLATGEYLWRVTASLTDGSTRSSPAVRFQVRAP